jgi:hypothetical protein
VSINQFISTAVAEKMAVLLMIDYFEDRAERGSKKKFGSALSQIPDASPIKGDAL